MDISFLIEDGIPLEPEVEWLQQVAETVLAAENVPDNVEVSLVFAGQEKITELNRIYRGKDRPTDVISFAMSEHLPDESQFISPPDSVLHLGEAVISYPQAVIQAEEQKHSVKRELAILVIHGILHLLGYDDEEPEKKKVMQAREADILSRLGSESD